MSLQWNEFLETGVSEIDAQHKELFIRVNAYIKALMDDAVPEEIDRLFKFLGEYIDMHFSTEEKLLLEAAYPDLHIHKAQHNYFRVRFAALKKTYDIQGITEGLLQRTHREVANWLITHVAKTDHEWVAFLKRKEEEAVSRKLDPSGPPISPK